MDHNDLRQLLTATQHQIAQGEVLIQNQRWRLETLQREGENAVDADEVLRFLLHSQTLQEQHAATLNRLLEGQGRP